MAGTATLGNLYTAAGNIAGYHTVTQRVTVANATDADAIATGIVLPAGAIPLLVAKKVVDAVNLSGTQTVSIGYSGGATAFAVAHTIAEAEQGNTYVAVGAASQLALTPLTEAKTVLLTLAIANGPYAAGDLVLDIEIHYIRPGLTA